MKSIPEIADDLRQHINTDNAAKRLIVEHILPLIGMNFDTLEEAVRVNEKLEVAEMDIHDAARDLADIRAKVIELRHELSLDSSTYADDLEAVHTGWHNTVDGIVSAIDSCVTLNLYER